MIIMTPTHPHRTEAFISAYSRTSADAVPRFNQPNSVFSAANLLRQTRFAPRHRRVCDSAGAGLPILARRRLRRAPATLLSW